MAQSKGKKEYSTCSCQRKEPKKSRARWLIHKVVDSKTGYTNEVWENSRGQHCYIGYPMRQQKLKI